MKITDNRKPNTGGIFKGKDVLNVREGRIVEVIKHPQPDQIGVIALRTGKDDPALVSLDDGNLWGNALENYTFRVIEKYQFILE
jgi:hypothetical protein